VPDSGEIKGSAGAAIAGNHLPGIAQRGDGTVNVVDAGVDSAIDGGHVVNAVHVVDSGVPMPRIALVTKPRPRADRQRLDGPDREAAMTSQPQVCIGEFFDYLPRTACASSVAAGGSESAGIRCPSLFFVSGAPPSRCRK
jgi:hypothetical protein